MSTFSEHSAPDETGNPSEHLENMEREPVRESVDTVSEMMDRWRQEYDLADNETKQELAYKIVKMGEALSLSGLHAHEVKIRELDPGVLGFFVPSSGEIAITPAGLSLPAEHFADVLVHEATHAGKTTGQEVADEGLTQIITRQKVSGAMSGIYEAEQQQTHETFGRVGIQHSIDEYNFDRPQELITLYLRTEWADAWRDRWAAELETFDLAQPEVRHEVLEHRLKDWTDQLEKNFQDAAPRLFDSAAAKGFDWSESHERLLEEQAVESSRTGLAEAA